jgi:hypothetical protein
MTDLIGRTLSRIGQQLRGRLSLPGDDRYAAATAIWAKPMGRKARAVVHCRTPEDAQLGIRAARDCDLPLSVRGGGHDWAGRALCDGIVLDLSGMKSSMNSGTASSQRCTRLSVRHVSFVGCFGEICPCSFSADPVLASRLLRRKSISARSEAKFCRLLGEYRKTPSDGGGIQASSAEI